jgi:hypothetical protein
MYALAAGVAGVGTLALVQPAEAKIVYTKADHKIGPVTINKIDLNHDGITDFTILDSLGSQFGDLRIQAPSGNSVVGQELVQRTVGAVDLPAGAKIPANKANKRFYSGTLIMAESESFETGTSVFGSWVNVRRRYLGLEFRIKGRVHYGWARLNVSCADFKCTGLLTGYAYETIPNKAIIIGATEESGVDEASPATLNEPDVQPASLGLLAMGSPALSVWRREESLGAVP